MRRVMTRPFPRMQPRANDSPGSRCARKLLRPPKDEGEPLVPVAGEPLAHPPRGRLSVIACRRPPLPCPCPCEACHPRMSSSDGAIVCGGSTGCADRLSGKVRAAPMKDLLERSSG